MKGFKVTLPDGTAKKSADKIVYAVGKEYKMAEDAIICERGFHFCTKPADCFNYYDFDSRNLVFEVEASGNISTQVDGDSKVATNHLKVIRQIEWSEMLQLCNEGKDNTGLRNTGNSNTGNSNPGDRNTGNSNAGNSNTGNSNAGDRNTGDSNAGNSNTGYRNTGYRNTGYINTGNSNTGNSNAGDRNTGNSNTGNSNAGDRNTGDSNAGNSNTGYRNTGYINTGNGNTGDWNTGNGNAGDRNAGNSNTGYRNTGNSNTGDWNTGNSNAGVANKGNRHTGAFCTGDAPFTLFNNPTDMTYDKFNKSKAYSLLCQVGTKKWISSSEMTDAQKQLRPHHEVQGGMHIVLPFRVAFSEQWGKWTAKERGEFTNLPNFNADIFFEITGVKI